MNKVSIRVPATSANCGSGFDTLGLACTLYNEVTYEITSSRGFQLEVTGEGAEYLKPCGRNLAFASFLRVWNEVTARERIGLKVTMHNRIPMSRGLGSSSSAIVAGIYAGNILSGNRFNDDELLGFATEIEGHPDNVAPALLGGFTISYMGSDGIERDMDGNPIDELAPSATAILQLANGPELTSKGNWGMWFLSVFVSIFAAVDILYADELFRWSMSFRIRSADTAEPSDWEIAVRHIGWTLFFVIALAGYIAGLIL